MDINALKIRWATLFAFAGDSTLIENGFQNLLAKYTQTHRHYHTLEHITSCLHLLDELDDAIEDRSSIEIAIWFHDVIYNPKRNDNEVQSARYASAALKDMHAEPRIIQKIERLILLTQHPATPETEDEKYLIDIDLSILSADAKRYDAYENAIQKEYAFVPRFLYKRGRRKILKSFLESETIYFTGHFRNTRETQARQNIERAIETL